MQTNGSDKYLDFIRDYEKERIVLRSQLQKINQAISHRQQMNQRFQSHRKWTELNQAIQSTQSELREKQAVLCELLNRGMSHSIVRNRTL